jgi:dolichol-phosphate mannosyltransferase
MSAQPPGPGVLVVIPTYDERHTLPVAVRSVRAAVPDAHVLVADDLAAADGQVHVLHRPGKQGLGAAYLAGFRWGLARGYDVFVEMDADGSHPADALPLLLDALDEADLVIGSRWVEGGEVRNWPRSREVLSRGGNLYTRLMLDLGVHDATAGYRAFRRTTLKAIDLDSVQSQGYCFQVDLTRRVVAAGLRVVEVPITFVERQVGASKMNNAIVAEALWRVTAWGVQQRASQLSRRLRGRAG